MKSLVLSQVKVINSDSINSMTIYTITMRIVDSI